MISKFRGEDYIMHRYEGNPVITVENFPVPAKAVFNCGQTTYEGKTVLLIAAHYDFPDDPWRTGIHVAMSEDGIHFDINPEPLCTRSFMKEFPINMDCWVIDPRVTKIDDTYYIIRPAQSHESGPAAVLEKTKDFKTLEFVECVALPPNRVPCLFPEKINGQYVRIDRPFMLLTSAMLDTKFGDDEYKGSMWISYSPDLIYWGKHRPLLYPSLGYSNYKIGPTPPIKTKEGWLVIIHGVWHEGKEMCYMLGAVLLDLENPEKIIGVLDKPLLVPQEDYELLGKTDNVVFAFSFLP